MKTLIEQLKEFNYIQIDKFVKRIFKHPDNTVTDDKQFNSAIGENRSVLEYHLLDEILEYFMIDKQDRPEIIKRILQLSNGKDELEVIDIANLAFLIWCFNQ